MYIKKIRPRIALLPLVVAMLATSLAAQQPRPSDVPPPPTIKVVTPDTPNTYGGYRQVRDLNDPYRQPAATPTPTPVARPVTYPTPSPYGVLQPAATPPVAGQTPGFPPPAPLPTPTPYPVTESQGILVESMDGKTTLFSQNADGLFNPASTIKVATSLVALRQLGPQFRFQTGVWTNGTIDAASGTLNGDLFLSGHDPSLMPAAAVLLARELNAIGIQRVAGRLVVNYNFVYGGTSSSSLSARNMAKVMNLYQRPAAASNSWYEVTGLQRPIFQYRPSVVPTPPQPNLSPATSGTLVGSGFPRPDASPYGTAQPRPSVSPTVTPGGYPPVTYQSPAPVYQPPVYQPPLAAAPNVEILGNTEVGDVPVDARLLLTHRSAPLIDIIKFTLNYSSNYMAQEIGAQVGGPDAIKRVLMSDFGVMPGEMYLMSASGLGNNSVTPRSMMKVYRAFYSELQRNNLSPSDVMPVAGIEPGTLRNRFTGTARGSVIGKTGTLPQTGTSGLIGQFHTARNETFFFVIINPGRGVVRSRSLQDQLILTLQNERGGPSPFAYRPRTQALHMFEADPRLLRP